MTPPPLADHLGRPFPLDRQLASGGEGAVYTLPADSNRVAKVYHRPPSPQTIEKLTAMIGLANPPLLTLAAWPNGLLHHAKTRQVVGFVMPRLIDCQPIQHLYNPVQRLKTFPRAGWTFQVRAALNLAAAFDEIHKAGCLVGDVNQSNAQVSSQALVRLIDCDSFQVRANGKQYLCEVGVPHYIPPELQGKPLRGLVRNTNHDRFGLAILIYQLLFVGRHPYAGVYQGAGDPSFEQLITEFRFAQGPMARSWGMGPPPHTPTFADIPPDVGTLFRRAFERGSEKDNARPAPTDWLDALKQLERNTAECTEDPGHKYWRGAGKCVWCRLAEHGGPEYYFGVAVGTTAFTVDEGRLQEVLRRLSATPPVVFLYERERYAPGEALEPEPLPEGLDEHHTFATTLIFALGFCLLLIPFGFLRGFIAAVGLLGAGVFGVWLAILRSMSPWHREYRRRRIARDHSLNELKAVERKWDHRVSHYHSRHAELSQRLHRLISECRGLVPQHQSEVRRLTANAEAMSRDRHLRLHLIGDADIPKIGSGRKQTLASFNIFTAADINENVIRGIKGFGDALTNNLLTWRDEVLRQFRFDPTTDLSSADQRALVVRFRHRQQQIINDLQQGLKEIESLAPSCQTALEQLVPSLREAIEGWAQADADLQLLNDER